jgi:3-oxoacyl-[acyl-carrier protein] reductase
LGELLKNTAREWGEKGIRSNALVAGFMETSMSSTLSEEQKDRIYKRTSFKIPTTIDSVANMVEFLLSDNSGSVTGANVFVDSGTI